ncbi:response regulator [Polaribacter marinivivus]|uniref:Response regulator n=1 Tax=Polaribacter marinivivus TaxID=1524260 RepID=A0ABV8R6N6_9FLAO
MPIKILIADDHPLIAEGIKNTFLNKKEYDVVGIVANGKEVIGFVKEKNIDLILLDINMPIMDGIVCAKKIIADFKNIKIAMLSMHQEKSIITELMKIGVHGYMLKTIPSKELLFAVKNIYEGKNYFNADVTKALLSEENTSHLEPFQEKSPLLNELTPREKEIITYISQGNTNIQIGEKLFISPRTVDTHRTNIMKKLDIHNVASLIRFAFKNGLIN